MVSQPSFSLPLDSYDVITVSSHTHILANNTLFLSSLLPPLLSAPSPHHPFHKDNETEPFATERKNKYIELLKTKKTPQ